MSRTWGQGGLARSSVDRAALPDRTWDDVQVNDRLVRVLTTASVIEGEIAKGLLEDQGIPVLLKGTTEDPYPVGPAHLFVPAEFETQARLVLASAVPPPDEET